MQFLLLYGELSIMNQNQTLLQYTFEHDWCGHKFTDLYFSTRKGMIIIFDGYYESHSNIVSVLDKKDPINYYYVLVENYML